MVKYNKVHKYNGKITLVTGLHIGGNKDTLQIGGVDAPVIKIMRNNGRAEPYIPASSLKGKLRSLLEQNEDYEDKSKPDSRGNSLISLLFGCGDTKNLIVPGAMIIRDAFISEDSKNKKNILETKVENSIDRITATAKSPRFIERVTPGVTFDVELILKEYDYSDIEGINYTFADLKNKLLEGLKILQNDYLGGSGTRGYGKVDLSDLISKIEDKMES